MARHPVGQSSRAIAADTGASLVEYVLLLALITLVCVVAVGVLGNATAPPLSSIGSTLN